MSPSKNRMMGSSRRIPELRNEDTSSWSCGVSSKSCGCTLSVTSLMKLMLTVGGSCRITWAVMLGGMASAWPTETTRMRIVNLGARCMM